MFPAKRFFAGAALCVALAVVPAAAQKRPIAQNDLYAFRWVADPQISPDGSRVAYTLVTVDKKHDGYETSVWIVAAQGGAPRQITAGPRDSGMRWSPDGRRLAFLRSGEKDGKPQPPQIYILPMEGGEARALTEMPKGASDPVWSPDGRSLAFTSSSVPKDFDKKDKKDEDESDVRVITRAAYRFNGTGYLDPGRPRHIWTVDVPAAISEPVKAKQITSGRFSEAEPTWSRDGSHLYFTSNRVPEPYYEPPRAELYSAGAAGGEIVKVAGVAGSIHSLAIGADGGRMAFVASLNGNPVLSYSQPDLFVTTLGGGAAPRNLTARYDYDIGSGVGGDQHPPRGGGQLLPVWSKDGRFVYTLAGEEGHANLKRIDAEQGSVSALTSGSEAIYSISATPDGSRLALAISTPSRIGDIFLLDAASGRREQLTHVNQELFSKLNLTEPETIWYKSFDGRRIQAWVQRPPDFTPGKKYPLILDIHGGPHAAYGYTFDHEFQWMAARGYVVLYPNPRGSTTYGQEFGNIIQYHYPGDDYQDLMAGVDDLIARGWVDPERMGVTGGSGGGVLTNWVIGHTNRFKAAVSQRSIADWAAFWYTADFTLFTPTWFRGAPWEEEADFKARSPIAFIRQIQTPLMLVEGEADYRTPPTSGGEQMFRALKFLKKPVVMVRFPGESHELSRSGKPRHRVERLEHILGWMDKYVLGQEIHAYDLQ